MSYIPNIPYHVVGDWCPACNSLDRKLIYVGKLVERKGKFGNFLGCSRYPDCKWTQNILKAEKQDENDDIF